MRDVAHVVDLVITVETYLILARVLSSWFPDLGYRFPQVMRVLRMLVDPVLRPFRAILPSFSSIDISPIVALVVLHGLDGAVSVFAAGSNISALTFVLIVVQQVLESLAILFALIVFVRLVMSLFRADPFHPTVRMVRDIARPLTAPFAGALPRRSQGFDAAAAVALVVYIGALLVIRFVFGILIGY